MSQEYLATDTITCEIVKGIVYNMAGVEIGKVSYARKHDRNYLQVSIGIFEPDKIIPKKKAKYAKPKLPQRAVKL